MLIHFSSAVILTSVSNISNRYSYMVYTRSKYLTKSYMYCFPQIMMLIAVWCS